MVLARSPLRIALLVVLAVGVVVAGGYALLADETPRPSDDDIENASERVTSIDGLTATVVTTVEQDNETTRNVRRVVTDPGTGKYRSTPVDGDASGYDLTVSNGTVTWLYDSENETVRRLRVDGDAGTTGVLPSGEYVERLLRAAFDDANDTASDVSALPMVPSGGQARPSGTVPENGSSMDLDVTYAGTERTNGREAYVLELSPAGDVEQLSNYSARVSIDTEWFVVLEQRTRFTVDDERFVTETEFRNVSVDSDLSNVAFRFEPPADADVRTVSGPSVSRYDSRDELAGDASLAVPDPEVPGDFRFEQGTHTVGQQRSVTLQYTNGTSSLSVTVSNGTTLTSADEGSPVDVGGTTGRLQSFAGSRLLGWQCGDYDYAVVGSNVGNETVVEVGRSMGCE